MSATSDTTLAPRTDSLGSVPRAWRKRGLVIGGTILLIIILMALLAPWLSPHSPYDQDLNKRLIAPWFLGGADPAHLLGTDHLGRDYFARMLYGARVALMVGLGTVALSSPIGITLGLLGGYYGRRVDLVVMYLVMVRLSLPVVLVALAVVGLIGSELTIIMAVLASLLWDRFVVVTRSLVMQLREREFVLAARAAGSSDLAILLREILPNLAAPLTVVATLEMANAILLEAALSFLGLGVKPPEASWGLMIAEAKDMVFFEPWLINIPGFALFALVIGINLFGDGLRDALSIRRGA
ncbi:MAG: ABC transporter permease [Betaproteobacteria bacterium]|nr:MAG: ABC transporter permease [Betaproteobacteria bacterium]